MQHITVLPAEAVEVLDLAADNTVVDATLGSGGHTQLIAKRLSKQGALIACDLDGQAIEQASEWFNSYEVPITLVQQSFANIDEVVKNHSVQAVDGILADLGWRMEQFHSGGRGFSFNSDDPLHMTFGDPGSYSITAADIVNEWDEQDIQNVLKGYGEEPFARRIAKAIVVARESMQIATARELAEVISQAVPVAHRHRRTHPATRSFQALRIAVNDEFSVLESFITKAIQVLKPGGRLAIISFHSLEDRIVKHRFRELAESGIGTLITKKPIIASQEERTANPRARSAKLRAIKKL